MSESTQSQENNHESRAPYIRESKEKKETGQEARDRLFSLFEQGKKKKEELVAAVGEGRLQIKNQTRYDKILKKFDDIVEKYPKKKYKREINNSARIELQEACIATKEMNEAMDRLLRDIEPQKDVQTKEVVEKTELEGGADSIITSEKSSMEEKVKTEKKEVDIWGNLKGGEVLAHYKNLENKIRKLKEHTKDEEQLKEIEEMLEKIREHFTEFSDESFDTKSGYELEDRKRQAELKMAYLNQRMVHFLEKSGQPIPEAFLKYKNFKPRFVSAGPKKAYHPEYKEKKLSFQEAGQERVRQSKELHDQLENTYNAVKSLGFSDSEIEDTTSDEDGTSEKNVNEVATVLSKTRTEKRKAGEKGVPGLTKGGAKMSERSATAKRERAKQRVEKNTETDEEKIEVPTVLEQSELSAGSGEMKEAQTVDTTQSSSSDFKDVSEVSGGGGVSSVDENKRQIKVDESSGEAQSEDLDARWAAEYAMRKKINAEIEEVLSGKEGFWVKRKGGKWIKGREFEVTGKGNVAVFYDDPEVGKLSKTVPLSDFVEWQKNAPQEKEKVLPAEKKLKVADTAGALGHSEIGGIHEIVAGEKKKDIELDSIKVSAGGKTYEFEWHQAVLYTDSQGKELDCIVLGKSKEANNPGVVLKDLDTGKVFTVGIDSIEGHIYTDSKEIKADVEDDIEYEKFKQEFNQKREPSEAEKALTPSQRAYLEAEYEENFEKFSKKFEHMFAEKNKKLDSEKKESDELIAEVMELKNSGAEVWMKTSTKWYRGKIDTATEDTVFAWLELSSGEKKYVHVPIKDFLEMQHTREEFVRSERAENGDTNTPTREYVSDLPSAAADESLSREALITFLKERVHTKDVSEKEALRIVERVEKEFDEKMRGETMVTKEKQKIGWLRSKEVEREMSFEEQKAQLTKWREEAGNAFDALQKLRKSKNQNARSNEWHRANIILREVEVRLMKLEGIPGHKGLEQVILQSNIGLDENQQDIKKRVEAKKDKKGLERFMLHWGTRIALGTAGATGLAAGAGTYMVGHESRPNITANAGIEGGRALSRLERENTKPVITIAGEAKSLQTEVVEKPAVVTPVSKMEVPNSVVSKKEQKAITPEKKNVQTKKVAKEAAPHVESRSDARRNARNFVKELGRMDTDPEYVLGTVRGLMPDHTLAREIRKKMGLAEGDQLPGLERAEISPSGEWVVGTLENGLEIQLTPELVVEKDREYWRLKPVESTRESSSSKKEIQEGDRVIAELRAVLQEVKQRYPDIFRGPSADVQQEKTVIDPEQKKVVLAVVQAEKKLREAEMESDGSKARRGVEEARKIISEVKSDVVVVQETKLPPDVFERFNREVTFDPKADALFEEWGNARNALKAAQEAGDQDGIKKSSEELRNVIEKITKEYSE